VSTLADRFLSFDTALAERGGAMPLTPWWRDGLREWCDAYEQHRAIELVGCVGRGGVKSITLYKLAAYFAVAGDFEVPSDERHFAIVISLLKNEVERKGLEIMAGWLGKLGVPFRRVGDTIELATSNRGIRVCAANVQAVSGWRAFFVCGFRPS
jgi:hypothetical protein